MSDQNEATPPSWSTAEDPPTISRGRHAAAESSSPDLQNPEGPRPRIPTTGDLGPDSSEADPRVLVNVIQKALEAASSLATIATKKRFGLGVQLKAGEAKAIAEPIARFTQRRFNIKSDLADAGDAAGLFASLVLWAERIISEPTPGPRYTDSDPTRQARHAAPESQLLADQPPSTTSSAPAPAASGSVLHGERSVGSGPMKEGLLVDFDNAG